MHFFVCRMISISLTTFHKRKPDAPSLSQTPLTAHIHIFHTFHQFCTFQSKSCSSASFPWTSSTLWTMLAAFPPHTTTPPTLFRSLLLWCSFSFRLETAQLLTLCPSHSIPTTYILRVSNRSSSSSLTMSNWGYAFCRSLIPGSLRG